MIDYSVTDGIGIITLDDGKANALSHAMMAEINKALDQATNDDVAAIVLKGRPGKFSAGFDLSVMKQGLGHAIDMVCVGGDFMMRLFQSDRPVIAASTGHALAAGAITLMCCDIRIGVRGDFKIGLNETSIGMTVPEWVVELANHRLDRKHVQQAAITARIYDSDEAVEAGFLDFAVAEADLDDAVMSEAQRMAGLDREAMNGTREFLRGATAARMREIIEADRKIAAEMIAAEN